MPMLTPAVWVLFGPEEAVPMDSPTQAAEHVEGGGTVVLPDYPSAITTLIKLGCTADHALYRANVARQQPQEPSFTV